MLEGITVDYMIQRNWAESWKAKLVEITIAEQKKMSEKKWQFIKTPWYNTKCLNICILRVPEEKWDRRGAEDKFEDIIAENFPTLGSQTHIQVQKAQSQTESTCRGTHQDTL